MKKYMKPQLVVERIVSDTAISSCVGGDCPTDVDCVNETEGLGGYYREDGKYAWCNYSMSSAGC